MIKFKMGLVKCYVLPFLIIGLVSFGNSVSANIDLGNDTSCAVKTDGALSCWGSNSNGQAANQTGTLFLSISEGYNYTCGIKTDGALSCWGSNSNGQAANQTGTLFQSISAGFNHTCGVKTDNFLACWGNNSFGKLAVQTGTVFQNVTTGENHTCGLKTDGTVLCWGDSGSGKTANQTGTFTSISAGNDYTCGIKSDGTLSCWGANGYGQAANQTGTFTSVSAGFSHTCGVRTDGTIWCWGYNGNGQTNYQTGVLFLSVGVGYSHTCGIKNDKTVLCWGYNTSGQAVSQSGSFLPDSQNIILSSSNPVNSSTGIGIHLGTVFSATFTSNINPATLSGNILFRSASGVSIPFSASVIGATISVQNSGFLNYDTDYTITFGSGITNSSGVSLLVPRTLNFRTQILIPPQTLIPLITDNCLQTSRVCGYMDPITETPKDFIIAGNTSDDSNKVTTQNKADPVTLSNGEFVYENTLLKLPSKGLSYELSLLSKNRAQYDGPIGYNWDHSYNKFLRVNGSGGLDYYNGKLGKFTFPSSSSQNILLNASISLSGSIYTITYRDGKKEIFGTNLWIATLQDALGNTLSFTYDVDNKLTKVTDQNSNEILYAYNPTGRIQSVSAPGGRTVTFTYSNSNDLTKIDLTNSGTTKSINFTYSSGSMDANLNHNVLSFTDAKGQTYVTNSYDTNDRVISQVYGNGAIGYAYTLSGSAVTKNTVTNKQGIVTEYTYDNSGNNTQMKVQGTGGLSDITYVYTYDITGQKLTETKPLGNGIKYTYNGTGDLIESRLKPNMSLADSGATDLITSYQYDSKGNISQVTSPNGKITTFTYNSGNLPTKIESTIGTGVTTADNFIYDSYGRIIEKRDGENNPLYYEYGTLGFPTKIKTGTGTEQSVTTFTYDTYGNPLTLLDGEGYTKSFTYDVFDRLITDTTAEGIVKQYAYDANNNQTGSTLFLTGAETVDTSMVYDILDNPTQVISEQSNGVTDTKNISYNNNAKISQITYQNGLTITTTYDMMERVKSIVTVGDKTSTLIYGYDNNGNNTTINTNGNTTTRIYDLFDRVSRVTDALGNYTNFAYDKAGNILTSQVYTNTGVLIEETSYIYDLLSRVTKIREKKLENSTYRDTTLAYYKNNLKSSEINALSGTTLYTYDTLGREISRALPNGLVLQKTYNKKSDVLTDKIVSSSGTITTTYGYDRDSRRTSMTDNLGNLTTYSYNKLNQLTQVVDPLGVTTSYTYDYLGNMLSETRAGKTTTYLYNALGRKTRVTDAGGSRTDYTYDKEGRLLQEDVWLSGSSLPYTYTYDVSSNLKTRQDPRGTKVTYTYDALDRVTRKDMILAGGASGRTFETFTYDALSRMLTANTQDGWNASMTYDSLGNQTKDAINATFVLSTNLLYDILGRVTQMPYTQTIGYAKMSYDSLGRLTKTTNASNVSYVNYTYNQLSLIREARKNNLVTNYAYDALARLSTISGSGYTSPIGYTYNSGGLITARGNANYQYNNLNEITKAVYPTGTYASMSGSKYAYDIAGNRMSESITLGTGTGETTRTTWNYNTGAQDRYATISSSSGLVYGGVTLSGTLLYDNAGNITGNQIGTQKQYEYVYDYANRIIAVNKYSSGSTKSTLVNYKYDGLGRRAFRAAYSGSIVTDSTFYGYYKNYLIEEKTESYTSGAIDNNYIVKNYIYGPNGEDDVALVIQKYVKKVGVTITTTTTNYYYHKDHLSSPEKISNDSGAIIEEYAYTPYGATFIKNSSTSGSYIPVSVYMSTILPKIPAGNTGALYGNNRLYTGREYDKESGLYYNRARYYDPTHGRFLSRDPIGYIDDVNPYRYVGNNPMMFTDPSGMMKMILKETGLRLLKWTVDAILLATSPGTAISNGDINGTYEEDMKNAKIMDNQIMHPSGEALAISFFLPGTGGKNQAAQQVLKDIKKIVNGHAINHLEEFSNFGIKTAKDLENHAKQVIGSAVEKGNIKELENGRTMIWDEITETVIFRDPGNKKGGGTIFKFNQTIAKDYKDFGDYISKQK